jgi:hypothetical protein
MPLLRPTTALRSVRAAAPLCRITTSRALSSKAAALNAPTNRLRNALYGTALLGLLGFG